jgi:hypothetical protein
VLDVRVAEFADIGRYINLVPVVMRGIARSTPVSGHRPDWTSGPLDQAKSPRLTLVSDTDRYALDATCQKRL